MECACALATHHHHLQLQQFIYEVLVVGNETPLIFSAVPVIYCRVLRSETVEFSHHMVRQPHSIAGCKDDRWEFGSLQP